MRRRRLLALGVAALAGCGESGPSPTATDSPTPPQYVDRFRTNLELAQSGITEIRIDPGNVTHLRYETTAPDDAPREAVSDAIAQETRDVASAFATVVGAGWGTSKLTVAVEQGETVVASYYIRAEWAAAWNRGNATAEAYGEHIQSTFETTTPTASPSPSRTSG